MAQAEARLDELEWTDVEFGCLTADEVIEYMSLLVRLDEESHNIEVSRTDEGLEVKEV